MSGCGMTGPYGYRCTHHENGEHVARGTEPDSFAEAWPADDRPVHVAGAKIALPAIMTAHQAAMVGFARRTLQILESQKEWSSDTPDDIASAAYAAELAHNNEYGEFTAND